ncbi:MAG: LysR substrate-binding domain-containing protein [Pseudomonadota bacterium]
MPPKSTPPLTWFRAFEAAARHLSFTGAAEELGFTQSAISQHVRALEARLGTALFVRGHRSLQLTDAGRLLLPDVTAAIAQLALATERFEPQVSRRRLTIAASASIAQWVIAPRLASFQSAHPEIALQLVTTIWPDDFSTTNADVEVRFGPQQLVGQQATLLEPSQLHAVAAPGMWESAGLGELAAAPLIQPIGLTQNWTALGRQAGVTLEPSIYVDTHGLAVDLAVQGAGVALAHVQVSAAAVAEGRLRVLPVPPVMADEGYYLAMRPSAHADARDAFASWLRNQVSAAAVPRT